MGWVGLGWVEIFSVFGGLEWVHYSKNTKKFRKDYVNAFKARLDKIWLHQTSPTNVWLLNGTDSTKIRVCKAMNGGAKCRKWGG